MILLFFLLVKSSFGLARISFQGGTRPIDTAYRKSLAWTLATINKKTFSWTRQVQQQS